MICHCLLPTDVSKSPNELKVSVNSTDLGLLWVY